MLNIAHGSFRLGKKVPKTDNRTFKLAHYLTPDIPLPPPSCDWTKGVTTWGMMLNDELGDCTCAAVGHGVQVANLNLSGVAVTPPDPLILTVYEQACGYNPSDPATDQGGFILDVLNWYRRNVPGTEAHHHKRKFRLLAYADPNPGDVMHIKQAIALFAVVDIGLMLPLTAQDQIGKIWDVVGNWRSDPASLPGSWGGHSVIVAAYDEEGLTCITWGGIQRMTWQFWRTYVDEAHALLYHSWLVRLPPSVADKVQTDLTLVAG